MGMESPQQPPSLDEDQVDCDEIDQREIDRQAIEQLVEEDPALVPTRTSTLLVEPSVLDPLEVQALLGGLSSALVSASDDVEAVVTLDSPALVVAGRSSKESSYEPHP